MEKLRNRMFEEYSEIAMRKDLVELIMYTNGAGTAEGLRELWGILDDAVVSISRTGLGYAYCMTYLGSHELAEFMTEFYDKLRGLSNYPKYCGTKRISMTAVGKSSMNSQWYSRDLVILTSI